MSDPLVTVVTPSFNQGRFIRATLDSVLGQDYPHLQYIVVDGGSTDDTVAVLQSITDSRLTWISEPDRGQSDALNKGMRQAQGEILTYINSDDLLLPGAIRFTVDYFAAHPIIDLVFGDIQFIDADGRMTGKENSTPFDLTLALLNGQAWMQPGTFWRRRVMDTIGLFDENLHYSMDTDYWLRAALANFQSHYQPGQRAAYRLHESSKTMSQAQKFQHDWERILQNIFARTDLPVSVQQVRERAFAAADWWYTKNLWLNRQYDEARPLLRRFLHDTKRERQILAAAMLIDSTLRTPLTKGITALYQRMSGRSIFR